MPPSVAAISEPTAAVVAAIVAGIFTLAVRWVPKTRAEADLDLANLRKLESETWSNLVANLREEVKSLREELREERERLEKLEALIAEQQREITALHARHAR